MYTWQTPDGSYLALNTTGAGALAYQCPTGVVQPTFQDIFSGPHTFEYMMGGVPVSSWAAGVPYSNAGGFGKAFGSSWYSNWGSTALLEWATQCLPVVALSPVNCRTAGNVSIGENNNLTVAYGNCTIPSPRLAVNPKNQSASVSGMCTEGQRVGTGDIMFGSVGLQAGLLATAMGDTEFNGTSYAVACSIDVAPTLTYRLLTYSRIETSEGQYYAQKYSVTAASRDLCTPQIVDQEGRPISDPPSLSADDIALTNGAAAAWQLLQENQYFDGFWPTLSDVALNWVSPYEPIFNNSANQLEDSLGLASAIALGRYWGLLVDMPSGGYSFNGKMGSTGQRVGPGEAWAVIYILPSLASIFYIIFLLFSKD